ncbi:sarcosine oxidase subunit gamma [Terrarubrum flagellatum]|uniref:sarcosine oxidase subunit gamma n=1 Tax=Terrirubrum flagellatum TaxID=2895980 RepID=UPI0031452170
MSAPEPMSPLAAYLKPHAAESAGVTICERPVAFAEIVARRGRAAELSAALKTAFGFDAPAAGRSARNVDVEALWIAPDTVLIVGAAPAISRLRNALARDVAAFVDQSGGYGVLRISGPRAREALAKGCRIDLHPSAFGSGHVARTIMAQMPVAIHQLDDAPTFDLIIPRTLAVSFADFVTESAEEFGLSVLPPLQSKAETP